MRERVKKMKYVIAIAGFVLLMLVLFLIAGSEKLMPLPELPSIPVDTPLQHTPSVLKNKPDSARKKQNRPQRKTVPRTMRKPPAIHKETKPDTATEERNALKAKIFGTFFAHFMKAQQFRYDLNNDGELDADERTKMGIEQAESRERMRGAINERYDLDGDGEIQGEERELIGNDMRMAAEQFVDESMAKYDLDGDGEISESESQKWGHDVMVDVIAEEHPEQLFLRNLDRIRNGTGTQGNP